MYSSANVRLLSIFRAAEGLSRNFQKKYTCSDSTSSPSFRAFVIDNAWQKTEGPLIYPERCLERRTDQFEFLFPFPLCSLWKPCNGDVNFPFLFISLNFQVFLGNNDPTGIVKNSLSTDVQARYVRFYVVEYSKFPCLGVEIYTAQTCKK